MLLSRPCRTTRLWSTGSEQRGSNKGVGQTLPEFPGLSCPEAMSSQSSAGRQGWGICMGGGICVGWGWRFQRKKGVGVGCRRPLWEEQRLFGGGEAIAGREGSPLELGEEAL